MFKVNYKIAGMTSVDIILVFLLNHFSSAMKIFIKSFEPPQRNVKQFFSFFFYYKVFSEADNDTHYLFKVKNEDT